MNAAQPSHRFIDAAATRGAHRARDLLRFAPLVPLSTAGGCGALALCLWPVLPAWWPGWLASGLALAAAQWQSRRLVSRPRTAKQIVGRRRWVQANALVSGVFWGATSVAFYPSESVGHQLLLAFVLAAIAAAWLPFYAFVRVSLPAFTVPALLPMAFDLLSSPSTPQTTMGSLLFLLIAALAGIAELMSRMLHADSAARRVLYHQATHDPLVGLVNRAEFHRRAQTLEIMRAHAYAILFIDLDHFKQVNDSLGHASGDALLQQIGAVLRRSVRKGDTAARLGGDEFAILMKDCDAAEAAAVAATIRERVAAVALDLGGRAAGPRVTASIGIACSADLCASPAALLEAADAASYRAKRAGRDRIEIATALPSAAPRSRARAGCPLTADRSV
ncbi:MAG TPA: GGDEF domain-containing protein [Gammaproteobacteria bacterium]|nr:GGDEF domain-containing protein [Gammaproteobacteria bacterium]